MTVIPESEGVTLVTDVEDGWDFFISYTQADRAWAEWIAWTLEEDGHRVLVQAWDFVPGSNWTQYMQDGATKAERTIAVLSADYLESQFGTAEWLAAWMHDPSGRDRKLLTVRVAECERPGFLGSVVGVDLFDRGEAKAKATLRRAVSGMITGRVKPPTKPDFPPVRRAVTRPAAFPGTLPSVWRVPARNPNFTGRDSELAVLARELSAGSQVTVQSLRGLGGVGKTQLAIEYAYAHAGDYDVVWFFTAEEAATMPDQYAALARELGIDPIDSGPEELRNRVHDELRTVAGWLVVFDNADSVAGIRPWLPTGPLSAGIAGHVIVTTRRAGFKTLGKVLDLDVIDMEAAVRLLRGRAPALDTEIAVAIATILDRLPLALDQAAAYLDRTEIPPAEYLSLLRNRHDEVMTGTGSGTPHENTIATVWNLSLERIHAESPAGLQLLDICAYLAPDAIPLDLFTSHPDHLPEPLAGVVTDPLRINDTIATVVDYSMAKRGPDGLQLHRLVQAALRARHHH